MLAVLVLAALGLPRWARRSSALIHQAAKLALALLQRYGAQRLPHLTSRYAFAICAPLSA